jgi:Ser/Thr protein kinase RdoA (MazF antagonist)
MSVKAIYKNGVFEPLEKVEGATPGQVYTAFAEEELRDLGEMFGWLKAAEESFDFWDNPADAVYDKL